MGTDLREQIYTSLSQKETAELLEIWRANDRTTWTETALDAVREILEERGVELPERGDLAYEAPTPEGTAAARVPPWMGWGLVAFSFVLAVLLTAGAIALADQAVYGDQLAEPYLGICLPISAVILGIGALVGARRAKAGGRRSWEGAVLGVWIGAIASILLSVWARLDIGTGQ